MKKTRRKFISALLVIAMLAVVLVVPPQKAGAKAKTPKLSSKKLNLTMGKKTTLKVKNTTKKVKWKISSGKKNISLKKKGKTSVVITGKKKGTAKVQAKVAGKKLICKITVKAKGKTKNQPTNKPTNKPNQTNAPTPTNNPNQTPEPTDFVGIWQNKEAGLYDAQTRAVTKTWNELIASDYGILSVSIDGVLTVRDNANMQSLTGILVIDKNIKMIGDDAFKKCSALKGVVVSEGVTSIGDRAFMSCSMLENVIISASVTSIGQQAFSYCSRLYYNCYVPAMGMYRNNVFFIGDKEKITIAGSAFTHTRGDGNIDA